jgi:hypothetical protein
MDGRFPTDVDYDFHSGLKGADSIQIASDDSFWANNGWNHSAGVTVVVGVKQHEIGDYVLQMTSPSAPIYEFEMERIRVGDTVRITLDEMEDLEGKRGYDTLF